MAATMHRLSPARGRLANILCSLVKDPQRVVKPCVAATQTKICFKRSYCDSGEHLSKYGGRNMVTALSGDGVGPEFLSHVQEVFRYAGAPVDFEEIEINAGTSDPEYMRKALLSIQRNGVAIKGNIETKFEDPSFKSMNVELRVQLELFANVVWCRSHPGVPTRHQDIDIILIRENTEGEYSNLEHENVPGVVESLKIITAEKSTRIAKYAFDYAQQKRRKKVTAIHKANIMKLGDGLFLESCRQVACLYPDIEFDDMIVDNASMQMVSRPQQFDVLVMPNLYGNILSNVAAGLVGGPGLVPGINVGRDFAIFEMGTRSSGRTLKGKNVANPTGILLASCDMLDYLGHRKHGKMIRDSVMTVLNEQKVHTPDLGGQATTLDLVHAIIDDIKPKTQSCVLNTGKTKYQPVLNPKAKCIDASPTENLRLIVFTAEYAWNKTSKGK